MPPGTQIASSTSRPAASSSSRPSPPTATPPLLPSTPSTSNGTALPQRPTPSPHLNVTIAAYVSGIKGKKNLLWFAPSTPVLLVRDGGYSWGVSDMAYVHRVMDTYERFVEEQIAVCPVGISGVTENRGSQKRRTLRRALPPRQKMEAVAEATGGEAFYNTNDLKATIAKAIDDGSHYYSLSYIPPREKDDGHYHTIKIAVARPGLHLVYRKGYNAENPTPITPASKLQMTQASMGLGALPSTELVFNVQVTSPSRHIRPHRRRTRTRRQPPLTPHCRRQNAGRLRPPLQTRPDPDQL